MDHVSETMWDSREWHATKVVGVGIEVGEVVQREPETRPVENGWG